ncbi:hypothetical protein EV361DRAFT_944027 [Lentinula raphanica]|nr:hypothetical protein EV361DRAFT_944027 [Lentinula raphanica]
MAQIPSYAVLAQSTARSKGLLFAFWPGYNVLFTEMYSNLGEKQLRLNRSPQPLHISAYILSLRSAVPPDLHSSHFSRPPPPPSVWNAFTTRLERVYDAFINLFTRSVPPISEARRAHVELRTQALLPFSFFSYSDFLYPTMSPSFYTVLLTSIWIPASHPFQARSDTSKANEARRSEDRSVSKLSYTFPACLTGSSEPKTAHPELSKGYPQGTNYKTSKEVPAVPQGVLRLI